MEFSPMASITNPFQRRLSKMYSDTKKSCDTVTEPPKADVTPELTSLYRKLRIQKDRLITWGLEWSDTRAAQPGDIDESLERAGLGDVVGSVMSSIKEILHEAERMRFADPTGTDPVAYGADVKSSTLVKDRWPTVDRGRFEDLLQQLTASIDNLYRLSASRSRAQPPRKRRKACPTPGRNTPQPSLENVLRPPATSDDKLPAAVGSTSHRPGGLAALLPLDRSMLEIDPDRPSSSNPPPYEPVPIPSNARTLGRLRRTASGPHHPWAHDVDRTASVLVFIDYAPFDPIYPTTGISPPMERLEQLVEVLHRPDGAAADPDLRALNLIGYFEDPDHYRFGLVYQLPDAVVRGPGSLRRPSDLLRPVTLLSALNADAVPGVSHVPYLEHRLRLAYCLVATFFRLHTQGLVHQDVTSNNVIFFCAPSATHPSVPGAGLAHELRRPYLCSFDVFSDTNVEVRPRGHIYRHPLDGGESEPAKRVYRPSFDVYGLGLILLEIGLWMPLSSFWKPRYNLRTFKSRLQDIYAKKLGPKCGSLYMRAVESCLSAADRELAVGRLGKKWDVQWTLYSQVVKRLEQCCTLDDGDPSELAPAPAADWSLPSPPLTLASSIGSPETSVVLEHPPPPPPALRREQSSQASMTTMAASMPGSPPDESTTVITPRVDPTPKPQVKVFPVKMPRADLLLWHNTVLTQLERLMVKALKDPQETFTIDLVGVGESVLTARPTIIVTCTSVGPVKEYLGRRFRFDKSIFSLRVRAGKLRRSLASRSHVKKTKRPSRSAAHGPTNIPRVRNGDHQPRPICGASIGVYKDEDHLPAVSYGGVIVIDGEHYGMTVHHLLDPPTDPETGDDARESEVESDEDDDEDGTLVRSSAPRAPRHSSPDADVPATDLSYQPSEDVYLSDFSEGELSPASDSGEDYDASDEEEGSDEEADSLFEFGDIPGVHKGQGRDLGLRVTQPAYDDVPQGFFPNEEDSYEDHLDSHELGWVHASSGIRRVERNRIAHEIDWALLKVNDERLQPHNLVQGGRRFCRNGNVRPARKLRDPICRHKEYSAHEDLFPNEIAPMDELGDLEVHCVGRTSGLRNGVISNAMSSVRIKGRRTPARSWHVLGGFGVGGDSGAWVIDNDRGRVCGHILAWCTKNEWAYICPMELLLEDIQRTLSARDIALPDAVGNDVALGKAQFEADVVMPDSSNLVDESHDSEKLVELVQPMNELQILGSSSAPSSSAAPTMSSATSSASMTAPDVAERSRFLSSGDGSSSIARRPVMVSEQRVASPMA